MRTILIAAALAAGFATGLAAQDAPLPPNYAVGPKDPGDGHAPGMKATELGPRVRTFHITFQKGDDPAAGLKTAPRAAFEKMWNGIALAIEPPAGKPPAFNMSSEWSPWSQAPTERVAQTNDSLQTVTSNQFVIYQITPILNINWRPTGG